MTVTSCPGCGEAVGPEDRFCEDCGQSLLVRRTPVGGPLGERPAAACVACGGANLGADGFCEDCGRAQPSGRDRMECDLDLVVGVSDKGRRRARNEDSMAYGTVLGADAPPTVVAVVCDGVATSDRADSASQRAVDEATTVLLDAVLENARPGGRDEGRGGAGDRGRVRARRPVGARHRAVLHVRVGRGHADRGDGRVGRRQPRLLARRAGFAMPMPSAVLTVDDTVAAELIAEGMSEEEANAVHQAHALSKWIGADAGEIEPRVVDHPAERAGARAAVQ